MSIKPKFNPTPEQINAAQDLFIAMAFHQTIEPIFKQMELDLLATGQYHYDEMYYTDKWKAVLNYPEDRIIRDLEGTYHMAGLQSGEPNTDCSRYYEEWKKMALAKGFKNGENTEAAASYNIVKAETKLIEVTKPIHGLNPDDLVMLEDRKKMISLLMGLYAPLLKEKSQAFEKRKKAYYDERVETLTFKQ